jgi:RNA polymerase sigma-70 factor (ECF subfamily)
MSDTPRSLLDRVRQGNDSPQAWERFEQMYAALIRRWLRPYLLQPADGGDIVQDVMLVVVQKLPEFRPTGHPGGFRCWLRRVLKHRLQTHWRKNIGGPVAGVGADEFLAALTDPNSDLARRWDEEHDRHLVGVLLEAIRPEFQPATWQAFWQTAILGQPPAAVAAALGLSANAVFIARSRVIARLREEGEGMLDR